MLQLIPTPEAEKAGIESAEEKFEKTHKDVDDDKKTDNFKTPGGFVNDDDELD